MEAFTAKQADKYKGLHKKHAVWSAFIAFSQQTIWTTAFFWIFTLFVFYKKALWLNIFWQKESCKYPFRQNNEDFGIRARECLQYVKE